MTQPVLASSNRAQLAYKLEGVYPTNFGAAPGGNGTLVNMTGESLDFTIKNESSKQLRFDRAVADTVQVGATSQGGINIEMQYKEYDVFIEGVLQSAFSLYGTNGVSTASAGILTVTSPTVLTAATAPTGSDAFPTLDKGQWFTLKPVAGASAAVKLYLSGRAFRVSTLTSPTSTVLTLDTATPIDTSIITAPLAAGWTLSSGKMSNANTMRSYLLEVQHSDVGQYRKYNGMIPSKMDLKLSVGSIMTGSFEFMGKDFNLHQASSMGTAVAAQTYTPVNAVKGVFDILENGASINASTYIKSADLSIDNSLRMQDAVGVFGVAGIAPGTFKVTAKVELYFANEVMYSKVINGAASSLTIPMLDVDGNGYIVYLPRIKYTAAKVATGGQDQDLMLSCDVEAFPDNTAGSPTLGKTVVIYRVGV